MNSCFPCILCGLYFCFYKILQVSFDRDFSSNVDADGNGGCCWWGTHKILFNWQVMYSVFMHIAHVCDEREQSDLKIIQHEFCGQFQDYNEACLKDQTCNDGLTCYTDTDTCDLPSWVRKFLTIWLSIILKTKCL